MPAERPPKPVSPLIRPEITRLPELTRWRLAFRKLCHWAGWLIARLLTRVSVHGLENFPRHGPYLLVTNHLGDADVVIGLAYFAVMPDYFGKAELYSFPVLGWIMRAYGTIWVHRGQPDRRALRAALQGLAEGRIIGIAPEGRESVTGALEEGTGGAAYLALKTGIPLLPVTFAGTENRLVFGHLKRLRRAPVTMTVGQLFTIESEGISREALESGTNQIMTTLAAQLPVAYQGVYREAIATQRVRK